MRLRMSIDFSRRGEKRCGKRAGMRSPGERPLLDRISRAVEIPPRHGTDDPRPIALRSPRSFDAHIAAVDKEGVSAVAPDVEPIDAQRHAGTGAPQRAARD